MIDIDELSEEEIEAVMQTPAFQKSLKYRRLAQGIEVLEQDDGIYRQLVATITEQHGSVSTRSSVEEVLDLFVEELKTYTEGMDVEAVDRDVIEQIQQNIEELRHVVNVDLDGKRYQQLTRDDKVREIQAALLSEALGRQTHKAAMDYTDVKWLFNGKASTGHVYDLMQTAGSETGFEYHERDEKNRIVVDADDVPEGVKKSLQVSRSE